MSRNLKESTDTLKKRRALEKLGLGLTPRQQRLDTVVRIPYKAQPEIRSGSFGLRIMLFRADTPTAWIGIPCPSPPPQVVLLL